MREAKPQKIQWLTRRVKVAKSDDRRQWNANVALRPGDCCMLYLQSGEEAACSGHPDLAQLAAEAQHDPGEGKARKQQRANAVTAPRNVATPLPNVATVARSLRPLGLGARRCTAPRLTLSSLHPSLQSKAPSPTVLHARIARWHCFVIITWTERKWNTLFFACYPGKLYHARVHQKVQNRKYTVCQLQRTRRL